MISPGADDQDRHQDRIITLQRGLVIQPSHARPGKDRFDEHRPAEYIGQVEGEQGHERDEWHCARACLRMTTRSVRPLARAVRR